MDIAIEKRLTLALDMPNAEAAEDLVRRTRHAVGTFKVGLELFCAEGPRLLQRLRRLDVDVFLDLKLHDIPNTVAGATRSCAQSGAAWLTLHALGGPAMIRGAREALSTQTMIPGGPQVRLLAVTLLTHHTGNDLEAIGLDADAQAGAVRLATLAQEAGADGCVCSPEEVAALREAMGEDFVLVTPGIRPEGAPLGDQARTATPFEAVRDGADILVVGRPIRTAPDPGRVASDILSEIEKGLAARNAT